MKALELEQNHFPHNIENFCATFKTLEENQKVSCFLLRKWNLHSIASFIWNFITNQTPPTTPPLSPRYTNPFPPSHREGYQSKAREENSNLLSKMTAYNALGKPFIWYCTVNRVHDMNSSLP